MTKSEAGMLGAIKTKKHWIDRYNDNPKICASCEKCLPYTKRKNKFCDHSCSASFNNKGIVRNANGDFVGKSRKRNFCVFCNGQIKGWSEKYCSQVCHKKDQWSKIRQEIETTGVAPFSRTAKRYMTERDCHKCKICGLTEWMGKPICLVLDHIDGNSENCRIVNLRLICPNCDSQTPTYKGRNAGKGRHSRRQRYADGKSY